MSDLFLLDERQLARIVPHFPLSHGIPRVDDRRVISGIIYVIRNGLQWISRIHGNNQGPDCENHAIKRGTMFIPEQWHGWVSIDI